MGKKTIELEDNLNVEEYSEKSNDNSYETFR
jgi:hypothetical protein